MPCSAQFSFRFKTDADPHLCHPFLAGSLCVFLVVHFSLYVTVEPSNRLSCRRLPSYLLPRWLFSIECIVVVFAVDRWWSSSSWPISAAMESLFIKISMCIRPIHLLVERHDVRAFCREGGGRDGIEGGGGSSCQRYILENLSRYLLLNREAGRQYPKYIH